jgi:TonB family protein
MALATLLLGAPVSVASPRPPSEQNSYQSSPNSEAAQAGVGLSTLAQPIYPAIARTNRIAGDVTLKVGIRKDGSIESVMVTGGHPMLKQAALDSAQHSLFECRDCNDEVTWYPLTYSFSLANEKSGARFVQSQNRVIITAESMPVQIDFSYVGVRSVKCLYLWHCGSRWGGEDFYSYRVRSPKCLYLWRCGLQRRTEK